MDKKTHRKTKNTPPHSQGAGSESGEGMPLHRAPRKGWANHLSRPSCRNPRTHSPLTPCKGVSPLPRWGESKGNLLLVLAPSLLQQGLSKALPEFLV